MNPYSDGHVLRIRLFRIRHGITLRELSAQSGITVQRINYRADGIFPHAREQRADIMRSGSYIAQPYSKYRHCIAGLPM